MPKEVRRDTIARKSASRPSILEIATNPTLAAHKEPVDASLKLLELQPYYSEIELLDDIKSK